MTTSCCPAFVNMIKMHFPTLEDNVSTAVSPMCAVSRLVKQEDPEAVTVFIGPCIAKKSEVKDHNIEGNADYAMTYGEIRSLMYGKDIELEPEENNYQASSVFGKRFGDGGGVTAAVVQCFKEMEEDISPEVMKCSGAAECKKALLLMKVGKLPTDFVEGMVCEGGCIGGPSRNMTVVETTKHRNTLIGQADDRKILENLKIMGADNVPMHRKQVEVKPLILEFQKALGCGQELFRFKLKQTDDHGTEVTSDTIVK